MLRRKFRPKMEIIVGRWRRLHSEERNVFFFSAHMLLREEGMEDEMGSWGVRLA